MILPVLAYCWKDCDAALRVINWIAFMSRQNNNRMRSESILLLSSQSASKRRRHREIMQSAVETFSKVYVHICEDDDDVGWPGSPNTMFLSALLHVEQHFHADLFWLEPDAVPLCEDWFDAMSAEWESARGQGKYFCGAFVKHYLNHLSGVSIYAHDWRKVAPSLADKVKTSNGVNEAWDTYSAHQIMPNAFFTNRIQHIFYNPYIANLSILNPETVLFHQDKQSKLLPLLDWELYGGKAGEDARWSYLGIEPSQIAMKFFKADNAHQTIKSQGMEFRFEQCDCIGGSWRGTFASNDEAQIIALEAASHSPRSSVREIDQAEYEQLSQKKMLPEPTSSPSKPQPAYPITQITASPAVLVDTAVPSEAGSPTGPLPDSIDDVLKVEKVEPALPKTEGPRRGRRIREDKKEIH